MLPIRLLEPCADLLDRYAAALRHGFEPSPRPNAGLSELEELAEDPRSFVRRRLDRSTHFGARWTQYRWIFDVEACDFVGRVVLRGDAQGSARRSLRTSHVDVLIAPWWRRRGYGTTALHMALRAVRANHLPVVQLACPANDAAAIRMIEHQPYAWRTVETATRDLQQARLVYRHRFANRSAA